MRKRIGRKQGDYWTLANQKFKCSKNHTLIKEQNPDIPLKKARLLANDRK